MPANDLQTGHECRVGGTIRPASRFLLASLQAENSYKAALAIEATAGVTPASMQLKYYRYKLDQQPAPPNL